MANSDVLRARARIRCGLAAACLTAMLLPPLANADATQVTVSGGPLTVSVPLASDFSAVTLDGAAATVKATLSAFAVTDARGTGAGWNVTVQASQFAEVTDAGYVPGGRRLPASSLELAGMTITADGTTSPNPSFETGAPWPIDEAGAVKIASAAPDNGTGTYNFGEATLSLTVPASTHAATYRSEIVVSVVSGP